MYDTQVVWITAKLDDSRMVENLHMERLDLVEMLESRNAMKRIGPPHEMGGTVAWLASDASSFVTGSKCVPVSSPSSTPSACR